MKIILLIFKSGPSFTLNDLTVKVKQILKGIQLGSDAQCLSLSGRSEKINRMLLIVQIGAMWVIKKTTGQEPQRSL